MKYLWIVTKFCDRIVHSQKADKKYFTLDEIEQTDEFFPVENRYYIPIQIAKYIGMRQVKYVHYTGGWGLIKSDYSC